MIFELSKYVIDIDVDKTKTFYNTAPFVSEGCDCDGCCNYEKAVDFLPQEIGLFFSQLGIEMKKVCEVYANCTNPDDTLSYGGFYHICGKIINGESAWVRDTPNSAHLETEKAHKIADGFSVFFQEDCHLLEDNFPIPAIQLEIIANLPWVLEKTNPYEKVQPHKKSFWYKLFHRTNQV